MKRVLFAARSATALNRLLDVLPVFAGDDRIVRRFTLIPGSDFGVDALTAIERAQVRTVPWEKAVEDTHDLILLASPKGELDALRGPRLLLPHGAGFGKTVPGEGTGAAPSGLDPHFLLSGDRTVADVHALAHPRQVDRLRELSPLAAARATVVGDPALERMLASRGHRDRYRAALGTGARKLVVLSSTWGRESLLRRRPTLPAELALGLPHDAYQFALIVHPNERSTRGGLDLTEQLAPALDAGLVLTEPYEEWAAALVAADAVVSDHGSTALYAAALGCPVVSVYDGGSELIPGSPTAGLLARSPNLAFHQDPHRPGGLPAALDACDPEGVRDVADGAFAERGQVVRRLRTEAYALLALDPPPGPAEARSLPPPAGPVRRPAAFAVRVRTQEDALLVVERLPSATDASAHHLAAEHGRATERQAQSAAVLYRRADPTVPADPAGRHAVFWTAAGWTAYALDTYPGCATAAAVLSDACCVARTRSGALLTVSVEPCREPRGRVVRADVAAVLSAVHVWLATAPVPAPDDPPAAVTCVVGGLPFRALVRTATEEEAAAGLNGSCTRPR